ncbi:DEAD/DEAH box helicase [uncultured Desulfobacter sp.]|uniref:DEAD/DEAH box helicase n=1 Tax=uncultured Desulfobacter sp. TaxID=240139 RepID=UPI0029C97BE1|nr:DEAD/DEAH box helicase [uncultured Desulfobacter sp.]
MISGYTGDLPAQAKTGSRKTPAFGIGLLHILNVKRFRVQALVMCPTRELAEQVAGELRRIARFKHNIKIVTICGGVPFLPQQISLEHQGHYVAIERIMADKDNY